MAAEIITLNVTPTGDMPVLHLAQYDTNRPFGIALMWGEDEYVLPEGITCELQMRKTDSHLVTLEPSGTDDNVITFDCIEQMCTCPGKNIAQLAIMDESDNVIHTLRFEIEVQRDVMQGGLSSASDIHNLETQIEETIDEKMGEDYYTKDQTDAAIAAAIADVPTFDPTNYYDKSDVDGLLADKADVSDLPDMSNYYTKSETDTALSTKADAASTYNMTQVNNLLNLRLPKPQEQEVQNLPASVVTLSNAGEDAPLSELTVAVTAVQEGTGTPSSSNPRAITGFSGANIVVADENMVAQSTTAIPFGQEVYGGVLDVTNGKLMVTHGYLYVDGSTSVVSVGQASGLNYVIVSNTGIDSINTSATHPIVSNEFVSNTAITIGNAYITGYGKTLVAILSDQTVTTVAQANTWFSNNPAQFLYELATPTEITLTEKEIDTLLHDNNIYSDTGDILSMKYILAGSEDVFKYIRMIKG